MGKLLSSYKKALIEDIINSVTNNNARYYAFAANPVAYTGATPESANDFYSNIHLNNWYLLFGKKMANTDFAPMIRNIPWESNTVYSMYNDRETNVFEDNFYVVVSTGVGGFYHVYKCLDNANGAPSTQAPDLQQPTSFTKADGYTWRYIYSISSANYVKFATQDYIPVIPNTAIQAVSSSYSGSEKVEVLNGGTGYSSYHDGVVLSVVNSTMIQISANASVDNGFYVNNGIYVYNNQASTSQLRLVAGYVSNLSGNWVTFNTPANTQNITAGVTNYRISPQVKFDTDGTVDPQAYSLVNATSNSIHSVVIIENGTGITRCSSSIVSNSVYGANAEIHCIVPPPGGHGADPASELGIVGLGIAFRFESSEADTIPINITYNKIGVYKNPYSLNATSLGKGSVFTNSTFKQYLSANVFPSTTFTVNTEVTGSTSGSKGIVAFSNSSTVYIVGDKTFSNNETITGPGGTPSATITINSLGDIYVKDLYPIYTHNIGNAVRANGQVEAFKAVIQV